MYEAFSIQLFSIWQIILSIPFSPRWLLCTSLPVQLWLSCESSDRSQCQCQRDSSEQSPLHILPPGITRLLCQCSWRPTQRWTCWTVKGARPCPMLHAKVIGRPSSPSLLHEPTFTRDTVRWKTLMLGKPSSTKSDVFFTHCVGGGVEPMCKNLCCRFLQFWRPSDNLKLTQKEFWRVKLSQI